MKKEIFFVLLLTVGISAIGQDTVRYLDPWYRFKPLSIKDAQYQTYPGSGANEITRIPEIIQIYPVTNDTVKVYGVAVTVTDELPGRGLKPGKVVLFRKVSDGPGWNGEPPILEVVDSAVYDASGRQCFFEYEYSLPTPLRRTVTCYEYYFSRPDVADWVVTMTDTMYIGIYNTPDMLRAIPGYSGSNPDTHYFFYEYAAERHHSLSELVGHWLAGPDENCLYLNSTQSGTWDSYNIDILLFCESPDNEVDRIGWGMMFPIVNLRCVAPRLRLVERDHASATVSWTQAEPGMAYELSYAPFGTEPDSGTIVGTQDTVYTVTGLESGVREAVWVRKACHYTLGGHDTVVWGNWSAPLAFFPLGIGEVDDGDLRVYARGRQVVVEGLTGDGTVRLYDMLGRQVAAARTADGEAVTLTAPAAGVFLVRPDSQPARRIVLTR